MKKDTQFLLNKKLPCKDYFDNKIRAVFKETKEIGVSFSRQDMNRFEAFDAMFKDCDFGGAACNDSKFRNVCFISCDFSGATFQDASFTDCIFINCNAEAVNFSRSKFINTKIKNATLKMSTLHQCYFENCYISGGSYHTANLYGTSIIKSSVRNIDLSQLDLEFIMILEITLEGTVVLHPYQISYIINGLIYAINNTDKYTIRTDVGLKSGKYFIQQLNLLIDFYNARNEFFPIANILLSMEQIEEAINIITEGIGYSIDIKDFRMLRNYCWLLKETSSVSINKKHEIYRTISSFINSISLTKSEFYLYTTYMGEIREFLLNSLSGKPRLEIIINTSFIDDDIENINELFKCFTKILDKTKSSDHVDFIEIRHNSPYELIISCIDSLPQLLYIIAVFYFFLSNAIPKLLDVVDKVLDIIEKKQNIRYTRIIRQHEINSWELEEKNKKLQNEKMSLEIQKLIKDLELSKPTILGIDEIRHTISASSISDTKSIPTSTLMGQYKK